MLKSHQNCAVLQWIPCHCNLYGNERADFYAKKNAMLIHCTKQETFFLNFKLIITRIVQSAHQDELFSTIESKYGTNNSLLEVPDKPTQVAAFCLFTGHNYLAAHVHCIGILTEFTCPLSDKRYKPIDKYHLHTCRALNGDTESSRYWGARGLLG